MCGAKTSEANEGMKRIWVACMKSFVLMPVKDFCEARINRKAQ